jgi:hypothetical protein
LIGLLVESVPGDPNVGVRNHDSLEAGVIERLLLRTRDAPGAETPVPVERQD